jgi:hypothetical protein
MTHPEKLLSHIARLSPTLTPEIWTITQAGSVDGVIIKIGGNEETIPVLLRDQEGKLANCYIRGHANAKNLARHYLGQPLRVHGTGTWLRMPQGKWELESLLIQSWEELDSTPANDIFHQLGQIEDNGWRSMEQPLLKWRKMRGLK